MKKRKLPDDQDDIVATLAGVDWKVEPTEVLERVDSLLERFGLEIVLYDPGCDQVVFSVEKRTIVVRLIGIEWDVDGHDVELPTEMLVELEIEYDDTDESALERAITKASDEKGWVILGAGLGGVYDNEEEANGGRSDSSSD